MSKIIIYGASGGIGSAIARRLNTDGRELHLVGRDSEKIRALADELGASHTITDVLDEGCFAQATADAGPVLGGLVYAVGSISLRTLPRFTGDDFLKEFRLNALGAALAIQAALPALKKSGSTASVVLFSSVAARQGFTHHASIGMAKGAVEGLVLSLAAELAPKIRINAVAPSLTRTPLAESILANEQFANAVAGMHAMQRLGTADDIAAAASFLLSDDASWITGQIIGVDGGRSTLRTKS